MSTPSSRTNRLHGLDLYAPRRARERSFADDQTAPPASEEQCESDREFESADDGLNDTDDIGALEWVERAIRDVVDLDLGSEEPTDPPLVAPEPPAPPQREGGRRSERPIRAQQGDGAKPLPPTRSRLDPETVPEPRPAMPRDGHFSSLVRLSLVIAFAAAAAFGLTAVLSPSNAPWLKGLGQHIVGKVNPDQSVAMSTPPSRLIVEDQQAFANQPLTLAVDVADRLQNESLLVDGLVQGTKLSAGTSASPSSWRLSIDKLRGLYLYAPKDFVGVMNTTVDLLAPDRRLLDSRAMRLKWIAAQPKPPAFASARVVASIGNPIAVPKADSPPIEPIDPGEAAMLMQRGRDALNNGDVSGARVAFRRLADAGRADAALALADTYDPDYLAAHNFVGVQGDRATARELYERAKRLGSAEAGRILAQMSAN